MSSVFQKSLKYLLFYIAFWFVMTQVNSFAAWASLYFPVFWVFVYFPAMRHDWKTGLVITSLSALFFESQYGQIRGLFLPLTLVLFLLLHYRRGKAMDSKTNIQMGIASLVHWMLIIIPTGFIHLTGKVQDVKLLWVRALQDAIAGQVFLFLIFPLFTIFLIFIEGRQMGDENSVSI